jgi:protein-S-isoprenylcysteine O-methyltransferase Ste14
MEVKKHKDKTNLSGEHPKGDFGQMILLFAFIAVWVCDSFFFKYSIFLSDYVPLFVKIILSVVALSFFVFMTREGLKIVFKEERDKPGVIRKGVFKIVRHPIYFGSILFYLGLIFLTLSIISMFVWFLIIAFYFYIARYEEKILLNEFGSDYEEYMKEVPMLLPFIRKRK